MTVGALLERLAPARPQPGERRQPRKLLWSLGIGVIALNWSLTTVAAYLPPVLERFTHSRATIGALLGIEGGIALGLPLVVGPLSDRTRTRFGRRRPYLVASLPPLALAIAVLPFMPSLGLIAAVLCVFFLAYYVYEPPYRSLYPDLLERSVEGRAQSVQHVLRGTSIGLALVLGGLLLALWRPLPFLLAAAVSLTAGITVVLLVHEQAPEGRPRSSLKESLAQPFRIVRDASGVRLFLVANTVWEFTFAGMRTFVVLYITKGLHQPLYVSSAVLAAVALGYLVAAVFAGRLGDRYGSARVIGVASVVYGLGLCVGVLPHHWHWWFLGLVAFVSVAAGAVMTLAWGLLFKLMPKDDRGATTGLATMTKGVALLLGPALVGVAIDAGRGILTATNGYAAMWLVVGIPILAALPLVVLLDRQERAKATST